MSTPDQGLPAPPPVIHPPPSSEPIVANVPAMTALLKDGNLPSEQIVAKSLPVSEPAHVPVPTFVAPEVSR